MGHDATAFKKAMRDSGLCHSIESALDPDISEMPFVFIFKGLKEKSDVSKKALEVLDSIHSFPQEEIEAVLHQLELSRSEITGGSHPFGLNLALRSVLLKLHGLDPIIGLTFHGLIDTLREKCEDPSYLRGLIERYFLKNPTRIILTMEPDLKLQEKENTEEKERLQKIRKSLSESEKEELVSQAKALEERQKHFEEPIELLPRIALSEVRPLPKAYALEKRPSLLSHSTFTNGLVYVTVASPLPDLQPEELADAKMMLSLLGEFGTKKRSFSQLLQDLQLYTGSFHAMISLEPLAKDNLSFQAKVLFRTKGLERNLQPMMSLLREIIFDTLFDDRERLVEMLKKQQVALESGLIKNAMRYAVSASAAGFSQLMALGHTLSGPSYLNLLRERAALEPQVLMKRLEGIKERLLGLLDTVLVVSAEEEVLGQIDPSPFLGQKRYTPYKGHLPLKKEESRFTIASQVAFNAFSLPLFAYTHPHSAACALSAQLMESLILHPLIREQGGAYGARAGYSPVAGTFTFSSYRDPHIAQTRDAFKKAAVAIAEGHFDEGELEEAKLSIIQDLDSPLAPGQRAEIAYSWALGERTFDLRSAWRKNLLTATHDQVTKAVQEHILRPFDHGIFATFTGKDII